MSKNTSCFQDLADNFTTISVNSWMELPGLSFNEWESAANLNTQCPCKDNKPPKRVKIKQVAKYYRDYVERMKLSKNFRNFSHVTSVKPIKNFNSVRWKKFFFNFIFLPNREKPVKLTGFFSWLFLLFFPLQFDIVVPSDVSKDAQFWLVEGYDNLRKKGFAYVCRNVVLAVGTSDTHNVLNVPGELTNPDWVFHDLKRFEKAVIELKKNYHSGTYGRVRFSSGRKMRLLEVPVRNSSDLAQKTRESVWPGGGSRKTCQRVCQAPSSDHQLM